MSEETHTIRGGPLDGMSMADRRRQLLDEEATNPIEWFYLSFVDSDRPEGQRFVGGVYLQARGIAHAIDASHTQRLNPGGEVNVLGPLPLDEFEQNVPECDRNRLLSARELG